jgi:hypothetical protein
MTATKIRSLGHLAILIGVCVFTVGVVGDIAHHTLPQHLNHQLESLLGVDAYRAHAITAAGMLVVVLGLFLKGANDVYHNHSR